MYLACAHILDMVSVTEALQEKAKLMICHKAHRKFRLLRIGNVGGKQSRRQRTSTCCNWSQARSHWGHSGINASKFFLCPENIDLKT